MMQVFARSHVLLGMIFFILLSGGGAHAQERTDGGRQIEAEESLLDRLRDRKHATDVAVGLVSNDEPAGNEEILTDSVSVPVRDPFNPAQNFGRSGAGVQFGTSDGTRFLPSSQTVKIPRITLRGIVHPDSDGNGLLALLEIGQYGVYMVREGDKISYDQSRPSSAIKIKEISRLSVVVEAGSIGNTLIIR